MAQVCGDSDLIHHLFVTYDMRWEVKLSAVQRVMETMADIMQPALAPPAEGGDGEVDVIATVAALHEAHAAGTGGTSATSSALRSSGLKALSRASRGRTGGRAHHIPCLSTTSRNGGFCVMIHISIWHQRSACLAS